ncbi:hypothetical protein GA0070613_5960 [Micromonospora inositola]|uniref:Uncharacterized protein n=1 Tax=Micromonospora inositola TaxID=47865 RepID=A0A1C5K0E7_9ACTN|nr:hypothetical protein GA0070613_5960 [Micromonospora inositola]
MVHVAGVPRGVKEAGAWATCTVHCSYHQRAEQAHPVKRKFARQRPRWPGARENNRVRARRTGYEARLGRWSTAAAPPRHSTQRPASRTAASPDPRRSVGR